MHQKLWKTGVSMNEIEWHGHETVDDLYDTWIQLVEEGNRAGLLKELARAANTGRSVHERRDDGSLEYVGPEYDMDEMYIMELSYGADADKVTELIRESDEHTVGENLQ